jgi:hypothetical protein
MAAARDVLVTTEKVIKEVCSHIYENYSTDLVMVSFVTPKLDDLWVCTGTYTSLFVIHGHVNDTIQSMMHGMDNLEGFWEDVYDLPMVDYLQQYEQWSCTQNQSDLLVSLDVFN